MCAGSKVNYINHMPSLCIFGASSTWGAWDLEKGGWANRLRLWIDAKCLESKNFYLETYNLGVSGDTTADLLERIDGELAAREPKLVLISLGDNDSVYQEKPGNHLVPLQKTIENVHELIQRARKVTPHIVWLGCKYVDESKTRPVPWAETLHYTNENIKKYDAAIKNAVESEKIPYLYMYDVLTADDLEDGLHPNARGHQKLFERVKSYLEKTDILQKVGRVN
jgi:lysophospholipase L1-like esterase